MQSAPSPPPDPYLQAEEQTAQADQINALTTQAQGDSASLMARYGTRLAAAGSSTGSPLVNGMSSPGGMASVASLPAFAIANMMIPGNPGIQGALNSAGQAVTNMVGH